MISYNTQIDNTTKKYKIQFETDDYDSFKRAEKICSDAVDTDNLKSLPTCKLAQELVSREGVKTEIIEPYEKILFKCEGPAVLLCVTDWGNIKSNRKSISKHTRLKVYQKYNGHCAYCGCQITLKDMQVDHIYSVYWYNGANDIENYNPACRMCNFYKSTMPIEDFREQLGKLTSRLEKVFIYRLAKKYGLIQEVEKPIKFYFEKENEIKWNQ